MMLCNPLKKCEFNKCGLCDKPCKQPLCKPQCPCIKKIEDVKEDLNTLKGDVDRNKQKIENNYNLLNDAISDLAERHSLDHNYVLNYIDEKDAENDYNLEQEIIRAKAAEQDIDDRLAKEIADRIEDVNNEEDRATAAEQTLDDKIDQEIEDRIADVDAEENRAVTAETNITNKLDQEIQNRIDGDDILQQNINDLEQKHDQDIQDMNDHLDDILGIDAQGVSEIKAILSDDDTTTGLITELAKKANKSNITAGTYRSVTVNNQGIVTAGTNPTTIAGYKISDAKIEDGTITLGENSITPLTQHQDISGKADSADVYTKTEVDDIINAIKRRLDALEGYWTLNSTTNRLETSYVIEPEGYR